MPAVALPYIAAAAGIGASLYGANKQSKAQDAANAANTAAVKESDLNQWKSYLMQRGLNPAGVTQFGQVPTNAPAMNTKLPLWANMTFTTPRAPAGTSMVRRKTGV